jgi:dihydrofolate synthase / folylpolyglutamate synthase
MVGDGGRGRLNPTDDAFAWIERLQRFGVHPGLGRTRALLAAIGDPQAVLEVALVAGTNGKGSTTALLDAMLRAVPQPRAPVARFVSPHLLRFEERFHVDGRPPDPAALAAALAELRPPAERLGATFFEVLVALALLLFARAGVHRAVLEVGMGGRLDATNAVEPTLSVVTQVDLDHQAVLGHDVATIAGEKAGILRPGVPAVTSAEGVALAVLRARAEALGAPLTVVDEAVGRLLDHGWDGVAVEGLAPAGAAPAQVRAPLLGAHQARNLAAATCAARAWGVPWDAVVRGAASVRWPGRLEAVTARGRRWLLDGAHNPAGARALATALERLEAAPAVAVVGVTDDRLEGELLPLLGRLAPHVVATRAAMSPRSAPPERVAERLRASGVPAPRVRVASSPAEALDLAVAAAGTAGGGTLVVAGSLYLVGEARSLLLGDEVERFERWQ